MLLPALQRPAAEPSGRCSSRPHLYGASVESVAQRLGIPAGTARSRLHYGLRALRRELQALEPESAAS